MNGVPLNETKWEEAMNGTANIIREMLDDPTKLPAFLDNFVNEIEEDGESSIITKETAELIRSILQYLDLNDECVKSTIRSIIPNWVQKSPSFLTKDHSKIETVAENGIMLLDAGVQPQDDAEFVRAAVKQQGIALAFASSRLTNDKDIVLEAVRQNGLALGAASVDLRNDQDVVLAALAQNGLALKYAPDRLRDDINTVRIALANNGKAIVYASDRVKQAL